MLITTIPQICGFRNSHRLINTYIFRFKIIVNLHVCFLIARNSYFRTYTFDGN
jgi:hypothetical protein